MSLSLWPSTAGGGSEHACQPLITRPGFGVGVPGHRAFAPLTQIGRARRFAERIYQTIRIEFIQFRLTRKSRMGPP
ncbi:MAG: hypothetical protein JWL69_4844 [Phycisphaerales bacterium]|nr:hypothetical protein [Phycisphaerales bacterium]